MKNYNRTIKFGPESQPEFYSKKTTSGLWTICVSKGISTLTLLQPLYHSKGTATYTFISAKSENFTCRPISYFPQEKYQPDDQDSTHAMPCEI